MHGYRQTRATDLRVPTAVAAAGAACAAALAAALLAPAAAALVAAAAVTVALVPVLRRSAAAPGDQALRRHLAICRRREEGALVLVACVPGRRGAMASDLRISDTALVEIRREGSLLVAVVDGQELSRERIAERLRAKHGDALTVGSATFPDDGLTLDGLVEIASARARTTVPVPTAPAAQRPADDRR
jgi:hypothetical protein